jgi:prolyl-tRNA synthetase
MMQDRKALQAGTSHFLGQNFAKASEIKYLNQGGTLQHAWTTSWGVSTRLVGGLIMTHADDDGLVLPPRLAPSHVVILPVLHKPESAAQVLEYCKKLAAELRQQTYAGRPIEVELDERDIRGGEKVWGWIKKGVPVRVEVGPRDMEADSVFMARRDKPHKEKTAVKRSEFVATLPALLEEMQTGLLERAKAHRAANTKKIDSKDELVAFFTPKSRAKAEGDNDPTEIHGGFAMARCALDPASEAKLKDDHGVTVRCIPLEDSDDPGPCILTGKPATKRVVFAKSY